MGCLPLLLKVHSLLFLPFSPKVYFVVILNKLFVFFFLFLACKSQRIERSEKKNKKKKEDEIHT